MSVNTWMFVAIPKVRPATIVVNAVLTVSLAMLLIEFLPIDAAFVLASATLSALYFGSTKINRCVAAVRKKVRLLRA